MFATGFPEHQRRQENNDANTFPRFVIAKHESYRCSNIMEAESS
jgi:hypothetical protein